MNFKLLLVSLLFTVILVSAEQKDNNDTVWICERWQSSGDVFERKVVCIKWIQKDCSNRMYKEICKLGV
jgi:hypothetical protein